MPQPINTAHPPRGALRLLLRAPLWLYRARLGWLLGDRFLVLTHTGRLSRLPRHVVLEVVRHERASDLCVVASGWGEKADWLRNVQKTPQVTVQVGRRQFPALAERLSQEDSARELRDYAHRYPPAFRLLYRLMTGQQPGDTGESCRLLALSVPLVALRRERPAPPIGAEASGP